MNVGMIGLGKLGLPVSLAMDMTLHGLGVYHRAASLHL